MKRFAGFMLLVLNCAYLAAQNDVTESLQRQFKNYQTGTLQEKLFVHTDKTFYLAGETVWFKVYAVDASFHKPLAISSIVYIEILNGDGKPVVQSKIAMNDGSGNGFCSIPGFLNSGNYIFRAYTSWMKNFPPEFYFEQVIQVANTLKPAAVATPDQKNTASIQFFPEGGSYLNGFPGKIAFKITDHYGHGLNAKGVIVNQQNDTIIRFQSQYNGMGNFQLQPEKNTSYYALLRVNDSLIRQKLPDAADQGFEMNASEQETGKIKINVHASANYNNTPVYLITQTRQVLKNAQVNQIREGTAEFTLDMSVLGEGISSVTLFNSQRQPVCERLVFKRPKEKLFIEAKPDQAVYETRTLVNINLATTNSVSQPLAGNCSLSVFMLDSLQAVPEQDIFSYLYLGSDLKGSIENPEYYFKNTDAASNEAIDNLLLTQGWRRFNWQDVTENKKPAFEFLPDIEGPVVNGKYINKLTGLPVGNAVAFLSIPAADYAFCSATSNAQGLIRFGFKDVYKNNALVIQPALLKDSNYRVDISNPYSEKFTHRPVRSVVLSKSLANQLLNRSIGNQVENTYVIDKKRKYSIPHSDTSSFYGRADKIYNLDDYTRFQTMEEVLREYVDDVRVRKEGEKFNFKVRNRLFNTYFEEDPLIMLDGIPINDATRIIALDPLKIKRIEVVTHIYYIGSSVFEGIININSYNGEIGATQIDPNALVVEYEGLQQQREFYSPRYTSAEEQESHLPDFRNVLYWSPRINTGTGGRSGLSFYTSDLKGKFAVIVQGITANGLPGSAVSFFDVHAPR